jgi:hypothetical protein
LADPLTKAVIEQNLTSEGCPSPNFHMLDVPEPIVYMKLESFSGDELRASDAVVKCHSGNISINVLNNII